MIRFDTPIPLSLILLWWLAAGAVLLWALARLRVVRNRYRLTLAALRLAALSLLVLFLLNPFRETETPDPDGFRVLLLADASQSMATTDMHGKSRFAIVRQFLSNQADSLAGRLASAYRLDTQLFSEETRPVRLDALGGLGEQGLLPGRSAIGDVLGAALAEHPGSQLGAVVLLSDGHLNIGKPLAEVCQSYRALGIPVTCVGIGSPQPVADVRVQTPAEALRGIKGQQVTVPVHLVSHFPEPVTVTVELDEGTGTPQKQTVVLPPQNEASTVSFQVTPWRAGFQTCRVRILPIPGDGRPDNDVDYAALDIREPDTFAVLYLGSHLDWEYKFLSIQATEQEQISLAAAIQTGADQFLRAGFPEDLAPGLERFGIERDVLHRFDAVVLDLRILPWLKENESNALLEFVEHRGGGLLAVGSLANLPQDFLDALPVLPAETALPSPRARLELNSEFIFDRDPSASLRTPGGLPVPDGDPAWFAGELKMGGRSAADLMGQPGLTALAAQRYGSGRIAYLGLQNTWRWRMADDQGKQRHTAFWNALLTWLGSTRKPRIDAACAGLRAGLGDAVPLDVDVLGDDFRPAPDAQVAATLIAPDGTRRDIPLEPAPGTPGRYSAMVFPDQSGEYRVDYRVTLPQGHHEATAHFVARQTGIEAEDTTYREDVLRDVARLTGGRFVYAGDISSGLGELPLSSSIPSHRSRIHWTRSWLLFGLLGLLLGADWFARRRIGLK
jgi:hypothetical protein